MDTKPKPWTRGARIAALLVALVAAVGLTLLHHPWYERTYRTAWLLATARERATDVELFPAWPDIFPWKAPAIVHLLTPLAGGQTLDVGGIHLATSLLGALATTLLFVLIRARLGPLVGALAALAVAASPGFVLACNEISVAIPATTALLAALFVERRATRSMLVRDSILSGVAAAGAACLNPGNVILIPAYALARVASRRPDAEAPRTGRTLGLLSALIASTATTLALAYFALALDTTGPASGSALATSDLVRLLGSGLASSAPGRLSATLGVLLIVATTAQALRWRAPRDWVALGWLGIVALSSHATATDLLPALVLGLPSAIEIVLAAARTLRQERLPQAIACAAALAWITLRSDPELGRRELQLEHESLTEFATRVDARVDTEARLASGLGLHLALFLGRPVLSIPQEIDIEDPDTFDAWIEREEIDALALYPRLPRDLALVPYAFRRYGERDPDRVVTIPPGYLIHVRP